MVHTEMEDQPTVKRLISLDAFRGFTIAGMILVNYPGSWKHVYPPLLHAEWNGLTPTDLIFPFFIFIVGVSVALAYTKRLRLSVPKKPMYRKIIIRTIKIFLVGILLWLFPEFDFEKVRIAGVLQRIAIVFIVCAFLFLNTGFRTQAISAVVILILYWIVMVYIPTPGYEMAMLDPGVNLAAWFDSKFLPGYLWQKTWDPEGLFSTLPSIATGISGLLAGHLIISRKTEERKVILLFSYGFVALILGYFWNYVFPVNKNIWTSSFVLVTSGLAAMLLAVSIYFVDVKGRTRFTHAGVVFGSNAITAYVLASVLSKLFYRIPFGGMSLNKHFMEIFETVGWNMKFGSLLFALLFVAFNYIPVWLLFRKRIFIKL